MNKSKKNLPGQADPKADVLAEANPVSLGNYIFTIISTARKKTQEATLLLQTFTGHRSLRHRLLWIRTGTILLAHVP